MYKFNNHEPIYIQVMNLVKHQIMSGELKQGDKVKSVRELALEFGVNPNTVQKSLTELEREGLLRTERTNGRFVSLDVECALMVKEKAAKQRTEEYVQWMKKMKYEQEAIVSLVEMVLKEGK